ncbi:DUF933 domain-containing protein [candidate division KSB1 bacterium]
MRIGIIGFKNSGKSTLFDLLTGQISDIQSGKEESRNGVLIIEDERIDFLKDVYNAKKKVYPFFELIDIPPLHSIKEFAETEATKIFEEAKSCDALINVVRQFENPAVPFEQDSIDPVKEKIYLDSEMILVDLAIIENKLERIEKMLSKKKDFCKPGEVELLEKCKDTLENEEPLSTLKLDPENEKLLRGYQFLTIKPGITVVNLDESEIPNRSEWIEKFDNSFKSQSGSFEAICCQAEHELMELTEDEQEEFKSEMGINKPAKELIAALLKRSMKLIVFLTAGDPAAQGWIIPEGTPAQKAAGAVHTDIEKGFIRAEVVTFDDFKKFGSVAKCKDNGCFKLEGKEHIIKEGDLIYFRFNI